MLSLMMLMVVVEGQTPPLGVEEETLVTHPQSPVPTQMIALETQTNKKFVLALNHCMQLLATHSGVCECSIIIIIMLFFIVIAIIGVVQKSIKNVMV